MKIAFLTHEPFYPPSGGGSAEANYLVEEMVRRGHEVHLFCPAVADPAEVRNRFGVELHEFRAWAMGRTTSLRTVKYLMYPFFLERLVERARRQTRFDLVLSQHAIAAVTAGRLKRRAHMPVVMNFLDYLTGFMETWPRYLAPRKLIHALERFELSIPLRAKAEGVLTVSDTLADCFAEAGYPRERLQPIYYGYDAGLFPASSRTGEAEAQGQPLVVMHGSFDHHHLGPIALEAVLSVFGEKPATRFRFVGPETPALQKFLAAVRARSPGTQFEVTGFVPYAQIARWLADASVGIVPYEESTGTHCAFVAKTVEYLATGLPVVSTPLKGTRRYFENEPLIRFSRFEGKDFGAKILEWLEVPLDRRRALGPPANERVRSALDWRVISRQAVDFIESIPVPSADSNSARPRSGE